MRFTLAIFTRIERNGVEALHRQLLRAQFPKRDVGPSTAAVGDAELCAALRSDRDERKFVRTESWIAFGRRSLNEAAERQAL